MIIALTIVGCIAGAVGGYLYGRAMAMRVIVDRINHLREIQADTWGDSKVQAAIAAYKLDGP